MIWHLGQNNPATYRLTMCHESGGAVTFRDLGHVVKLPHLTLNTLEYDRGDNEGRTGS